MTPDDNRSSEVHVCWFENSGLSFGNGYMILVYRLGILITEVRSMQRSGTELTRSQIQPSKPKQEITKITKSQNTKRTYGQPKR